MLQGFNWQIKLFNLKGQIRLFEPIKKATSMIQVAFHRKIVMIKVERRFSVQLQV